MKLEVLETNTSIYTQSPTDATGLDSFVGLSVLVLRGNLIAFPHSQTACTGKVEYVKQFVSTLLVAMH